jgi:ubiquinol oxidase
VIDYVELREDYSDSDSYISGKRCLHYCPCHTHHTVYRTSTTHICNVLIPILPLSLLSLQPQMYASTRSTASALVNKRAAAKLSRALQPLDSPTIYIKPCASCLFAQRPGLTASRHFTSTPRVQEKYFPAPAHSENIKITPPAWHHPVYTEQQMNAISVAHRLTQNWSDYVAITMVRILRFGMDTATGYSHPNEAAKKEGSYLGLSRVRSWFGPSPMSERKWLMRFLFLESVAGVPGMVAGSVRHLHSLRRLKRDNGW